MKTEILSIAYKSSEVFQKLIHFLLMSLRMEIDDFYLLRNFLNFIGSKECL